MISFFASTEQDTEAFARQFALGLLETNAHKTGLVTHLHGDLGAGKTTFVRGMLQSLGFDGPVRSPTYNIVQPYEVGTLAIYHFDLYRVNDPEELEALGFRDYFGEQNLCFLEWPEKGSGLLPEPDIAVYLEYEGSGRRIKLKFYSKKAKEVDSVIQL